MLRAPAVLVLAATLLQSQAQPPTFKARIDLVQVDVVVVDQNGAPVRGLKAAEFALLDRGKSQAIASFDEVEHTRPRDADPPARATATAVARDVSDNQSAQSGRLIVMVVDDLHIYKERTERAKAIARNVLAEFGPQSSMAVLFTSGEHSTQVTEDPSRLAAAVDTLKGRQSWRRPHPAIDKQTGDRIDAEDSLEVTLAKIQKTQDTKPQDFFDNITKYKTLQDAARMLGTGDARRKAFVLISEGIAKELSGLFGAMSPAGGSPQGGAEYAATGNAAATMVVQPQTYHDFALIDMMESMRRSNVATYAIDPRGRVESKDLARECVPAPRPGIDPCSSGFAWNSDVRLAQNGLTIMAEASGGFAITNTDDFTSGIARIVDDLDHYYLLGFYPAETKGKGYRPLDVRIPAHPEWQLRFRHGYMPGGPPSPAKSASELIALSGGVLPKTDLPLRLAAVVLPGSGATARVALVLEVSVPRRAVEDSDGRLRDTLKYEVLIVDEKRAKVRSVSGREGRLTLSVNTDAGPPPEVATYQMSDTIDVQPGRFEFRVSAISGRLGKGGSVYLPVEIPDFRAAPVALGGVLVGYVEGARVPVAPRTPAPSQRLARGSPPAPDPRPVLPFAPTLDRAFTAADTVRVYAEGVTRGSARPVATVQVLDDGGRVLRSPSASLSVAEAVRIHAEVSLRGLSAGGYVLRVSLGSGGSNAVREVGFTVR